jgi:2,4-dienoyl-CoA reductase-like NADH-dependent reductase (Old Yellow Enzyme family)
MNLMSNALFSALPLRALTLPNRVVVSPMCQYSAMDGNASDWHILHLGQYVISGAGLFMLEATAVEPAGRITPQCLGLWNDANEAALKRVLDFVRPFARMPLGIQLGHAGRKASVRSPGAGRGTLTEREGGWQTYGPTALPYGSGWPLPWELDLAGMRRIVRAYEQAARRADRLGFDVLEIHAAHGYLLSSFLSPLANVRTDDYGGDARRRMRFPLEVFDAVRAAWPEGKPLGVRFNGTDWTDGGLTVDDGASFAEELRKRGCDFVDISSGGNAPSRIPLRAGYQVPFATHIKRNVDITTMCVGLIRDPVHAEEIVAKGEADLVGIGRGLLHNPRWVWHAAEALGIALEVPHQYLRGATRQGVPSQDMVMIKD